MDVFYYWKDYAEDQKAGRVGRFRSKKERLDELQSSCPSFIWAFKTPPGRKGEVQLLARLLWSDKALVTFTPAPDDSHIFYDPDHPLSVWFDETDTERALTEVTDWVRTGLPIALASNFQGVNGQHPMRGATLTELNRIAKQFPTRPFRTAHPTEA